MANELGLFTLLRIGPYICGEWENGGLPWWLLKKNDIKMRTSDARESICLKRYTGQGPLVNSEFYPGWLVLWGQKTQSLPSTDSIISSARQMFEMGANVNFYMIHGGTNFGFWNGAETNAPGTFINRFNDVVVRQINLTGCQEGDILSIVVENQGRQTFETINDEKMRITQKTTGGHGIYFGEFFVKNPIDTFIDTSGWGKGVAFVNGNNIGRYWASQGPQVLLEIFGYFGLKQFILVS
uniref:Glyco_hydro_35 domain-containing protein n=1 Tax=Heterorhabditis bacteriophora TaxID=37862 RepID=A0A1I7XMM2_HETBA